MPSVPSVMLLGAGESTASSWKTGCETSSCLIGLNEVQQNIKSKAKQIKLFYHDALHAMVKRFVNLNFSCSIRLVTKSGDVMCTKKILS